MPTCLLKMAAKHNLKDLALLDKLGQEETEKFVHKAISDICDKDGLHYQDFAKKMSLSEYSRLKLTMYNILKSLMRDKLEKDIIISALPDVASSSVIAGCLCVRRDEIRAAMIKNTVNITHTQLSDFDWRLKLVMSSDQLGSVQQPLCSVDFDVCKDGHNSVESIELSREELDKFVTSLEAANKVVSQLRT